jgi:hypothetical protein
MKLPPVFNPPSRYAAADEKRGLIPRCFASKPRVQGSTPGL